MTHIIILVLYSSWLKRLWSRRSCCRKTKIDADDFQMTSHLRREYNKPKLGDMTLAEYTEKVIIYGYLMVRMNENSWIKIYQFYLFDLKKIVKAQNPHS